MTKLAPDVYDDNNGGMHIDMHELIEAHGYDDTPENRVVLLKAWREFLHNTSIQLIEED